MRWRDLAADLLDAVADRIGRAGPLPSDEAPPAAGPWIVTCEGGREFIVYALDEKGARLRMETAQMWTDGKLTATPPVASIRPGEEIVVGPVIDNRKAPGA